MSPTFRLHIKGYKVFRPEMGSNVGKCFSSALVEWAELLTSQPVDGPAHTASTSISGKVSTFSFGGNVNSCF